ncbi:MAG: RNA polymerase factor sigma-54 [Chlamydiae bacterium]|nr:RNA polymerase factor sigma-54 [Chlamydiota bacterium]MBI3276844.1 RNA polymerase factor sigma-54 [Chlamydiota bacterium]
MAIRLEQVQKQTQKLVMSPQMQQAIHFLQLPMMELSTLVQQEMTENPVLEEIDREENLNDEKEATDPKDPEVDFDDEFSRLVEMDDEWREYYRQSGSFSRLSEDDEKKRRFYEESITHPESLEEHLLKQWRAFTNQDGDLSIGELMIGNIDENGYLTTSLEELAQLSGKSIESLEKALQMIQTFHPVGVGARNLKECLLLQLARLGKAGSIEARIVESQLEELGKRNFAQIAKILNLPLKDVQKRAEMIGTLEPKPGRIFDQERTQYVTPDIIVEKVGDEFVVVLNDERIPHLRISHLYRGLMGDKGLESQTKDYIRQKVKSGKWLIKNIQQRQQTIFNIAQTIVKEQQGFFEHGVSSLKPFTMQEVATLIGVHESTVSRAIAGKHMSTPKGLFQMKYFFTPGFQTQSGEDISTTNIKETVGELVAKEDSLHPLSDQEMVATLKSKGIDVARRTVTKYRKELKILPSNLRKKY